MPTSDDAVAPSKCSKGFNITIPRDVTLECGEIRNLSLEMCLQATLHGKVFLCLQQEVENNLRIGCVKYGTSYAIIC